MKWNKFLRVIKQLPHLKNVIGSPLVVSAPLNHSPAEAEKILKEWVTEHVDFVAFRPFGSLDLEQKSTFSPKPLKHHPRNNEHYPAVQELTTTFHISAHIEGEAPGSRRKYLDNRSIAETIADFKQWHAQYWAQQGKQLVLEYVLKTTSRGNNRDLCTRKDSYEVYIF